MSKNSLLRQEVNAIMKAKRWNMSGIASAVGVTTASLSKTLSRNNPSNEFLEKLSKLQAECRVGVWR